MASKYTVKSDDTLFEISERFYGDGAQYKRIASYNGIANPDEIDVGTELKFPDRIGGDIESVSTVNNKPTLRILYPIAARKGTLRLRLCEGRSKALANIQYKLSLLSKEFSGVTDDEGYLEFVGLESSTEATLSFLGLSIPVTIGEIPSPTSTEGQQVRLNNLGYEAGRVDGVFGPKTKAAIKAFQSENQRLKATGEMDQDTAVELCKAHGC